MSSETIHTIDLKNVITIDQAWQYKIVPQSFDGHILKIGVGFKSISSDLKDELEIVLGKNINLVGEDEDQIIQKLNSLYPRSHQATELNTAQTNQYRLNVNDSNFLETLVKEAKSLNSSDIHVETYGEKCRIRFRVDGVLIDRHKLNKSEYPTLINKIKIASSCDIAEKRMPQDGRIRFKFNNSNLDIR
ncbi:MAG: ATPase, T2SS/T4P/T4SS family, partial [Sphingobacteriaceae bacterium]